MCGHMPPLYEEALLLCQVAKNEIPSDKIQSINSLYGYYLFYEKSFLEAIKQFELAKESHYRVVELIPEICPSFYNTKPLEHDYSRPLDNNDKEKAIRAIIPYLNNIREKFPVFYIIIILE